MFRLAPYLAVAAAVLVPVAPTLAADFSDNFGSDTSLRSGFSDDWANSDAGDPLTFELGTRYWYSWGAQSFDIGTGAAALTDNDTTQSVETHFRINDQSTKFYAKGLAGLSYTTGGNYSGLDAGAISGGGISYVGADLGYAWVGDFNSPVSFGPFAGYMYWNDSPNASTTSMANSYTTATSASDISYDPVTGKTSWPGDSTPNRIETNMLRLGGRAWYLQGTADMTYSKATIGNPSDSDPTNPPNYDTAPSFSNQTYITRGNPWSMFRYGALAEFTYNF